jgi:hypothetical protein
MRNYKLTQQDYKIAYKFLHKRATVNGMQAMRVLDFVPNEQRERIIKFLTFQHCVKFI